MAQAVRGGVRKDLGCALAVVDHDVSATPRYCMGEHLERVRSQWNWLNLGGHFFHHARCDAESHRSCRYHLRTTMLAFSFMASCTFIERWRCRNVYIAAMIPNGPPRIKATMSVHPAFGATLNSTKLQDEIAKELRNAPRYLPLFTSNDCAPSANTTIKVLPNNISSVVMTCAPCLCRPSFLDLPKVVLQSTLR